MDTGQMAGMAGMDPTEHLGTLPGHLVPGLLFVVWAALWLARLDSGAAPFRAPLERLLAPTLPVAGALGELWWAHWRLVDSSIINYQHATMYLGFALAAATDALAVRSLASPRTSTAALGGAFAVAGFLFVAHGTHAPLSGAVHQVLAVLLLAVAVACVAEAARPTHGLTLARCWLTLAVGGWFCVTGWILYRSGWDPDGMASVMKAHLLAAWTVMATGAVAVAVEAIARARARSLRGVRADASAGGVDPRGDAAEKQLGVVASVAIHR